MAGRGLAGGLPGRAALTAAPGLIAGEGIKDAADAGLANYDADQRQQMQRQELGLREEEGARAERRLDMAASLMPLQRTALEQENDQRRLTISEATRKAERDKAASAEWEQMHTDISSGALTKGPDIHARIGNILAKKGEFGHLAEWFKDHEILTKPGRDGEEAGRVMEAYGRAITSVKTNPADVKSLIDIAVEARTKNPSGYALVGKGIDKLVDEAVTANAPEPVAKAFRAYQASTIGDPKLSKLAAWETAAKDLDPGTRVAFDKYMPAEVKQDLDARGAGKEAGAKAAATLPTKLAEIKATGAEQRETEKVKGEVRLQVLEKTDLKDLQTRSRMVTDQIKGAEKALTTTSGSEEQQAKKDEIAELKSELKDIDGEIKRRRSGGKGEPAKGDEPAGERPKGIKAQRLREGRDTLKDATSYDQVKKALDSPKAKAYWSDEEINTMLTEARRRFGGK